MCLAFQGSPHIGSLVEGEPHALLFYACFWPEAALNVSVVKATITDGFASRVSSKLIAFQDPSIVSPFTYYGFPTVYSCTKQNKNTDNCVFHFQPPIRKSPVRVQIEFVGICQGGVVFLDAPIAFEVKMFIPPGNTHTITLKVTQINPTWEVAFNGFFVTHISRAIVWDRKIGRYHNFSSV